MTYDPTTTDDGLASLDEARHYLGNISRSSLYGLLRSGQLPSVMLGKLRRIPRRALREFAGRLAVAK
jgi:excisionase family DNA binding protein